ncbi:integrase core domain-containing protein, partial [Stappia stellulata]|uniref:integrase core domain-containing protein n=1 Tax=Stappia stellulata TaxID=71235 RepID=UPI001CD344AA
NGKAERFIQTLLREWAYGLAYPTSQARNADLPRWLDWFNWARQHSALNGLPPLQRVNDLLRNHI